VLVIGRRRRASYGRVAIDQKAKKSVGAISVILASNLRLRNGDMFKVAPLKKTSDEEQAEGEASRSGDLLLLKESQPPTLQSVTFAPIEDSLRELEAGEGGDELTDEEIQSRFLQDYTADMDKALVKKGHVLRLMDAKGKKLEFIISHASVKGGEEGGGEDKDEPAGMFVIHVLRVKCLLFSVFI
jgi:hypothetical protein